MALLHPPPPIQAVVGLIFCDSKKKSCPKKGEAGYLCLMGGAGQREPVAYILVRLGEVLGVCFKI